MIYLIRFSYIQGFLQIVSLFFLFFALLLFHEVLSTFLRRARIPAIYVSIENFVISADKPPSLPLTSVGFTRTNGRPGEKWAIEDQLSILTIIPS